MLGSKIEVLLCNLKSNLCSVRSRPLDINSLPSQKYEFIVCQTRIQFVVCCSRFWTDTMSSLRSNLTATRAAFLAAMFRGIREKASAAVVFSRTIISLWVQQNN